MRTLKESLAERMRNENFRREYEAVQPEINAIRAEIEARPLINMERQDAPQMAAAYSF